MNLKMTFGFTYKSNNEISTVGYSTNLSIEIIEQAIESNVDLIITHHDAWDFIHGLRNACKNKLKENNISHFWVHGPLDFVDFGSCTSLMKVIEVDTIEKYSEYHNGDLPGVVEFTHQIDLDVLVGRMKQKLNEPIRAWKNNEKRVQKVGVLTGAGHSTDHIKLAVDDGCDTYITGEATLYTIQYAQFAGINLLVGSHTFTEIFGVESLANKVKESNDEIRLIQLKEEHFELNH
ncbi:Nif3-like dinuclear metal center hexameric protein [Ornithinibacillus caprae]|uniref:Nif3-like dinuclear metal center hexameric protein n=1 Tax=Ornithinibacillus caprae TaxID=2678566 RepID=UPI001FE37BC2|nr:Nif3-like dinuclear metal center hexameric protein [Ornithinibacillus caprae]